MKILTFMNIIIREYSIQNQIQVTLFNLLFNFKKTNLISMESAAAIELRKSGKSPINIKDEVARIKEFPPLIMRGHWLKDGKAVLINERKTAMIRLKGHRLSPILSGGPLLNDEFEFVDAHFHWGETDSIGSEHQINGTWFSMEAHVVHFNRKYKKFDKCLKHKDGLCILVYFFLVTRDAYLRSNPYIEDIVDSLQFIQTSGSHIQIPSNSLYWMREAIYGSKYYTYYGSYEIKGDPECAIWIVFPLIIPITSNQVNQFRKLRDENENLIVENRSKVNQPDGRPIYLVVNNTER